MLFSRNKALIAGVIISAAAALVFLALIVVSRRGAKKLGVDKTGDFA